MPNSRLRRCRLSQQAFAQPPSSRFGYLLTRILGFGGVGFRVEGLRDLFHGLRVGGLGFGGLKEPS